VEWSYHSGGNPSTQTGTDFGVADALKNYGGFSSAVSGNNFNFLFRALQSEGRLQVLSRPQILTADNQPANINIGQKVPTVTDSRVTQYGDSINSFAYQDVGVTLKVTPRISPDGFVKMDINPMISQLSSALVQISKGFSVPIINQRSATTTVSVQSGQSILIGGLIGTTDDATTKRMPFLGKIPILGALFRSSQKATTRTELLILLTPQVLVKGEEQGTTKNALSTTREQLDRSAIRGQFNTDPLQRQILEPLYPELRTNAPSQKPGKPGTSPKSPIRSSDFDLYK
jgi:type II secretory pathway component GspD/PulD (secretin)